MYTYIYIFIVYYVEIQMGFLLLSIFVNKQTVYSNSSVTIAAFQVQCLFIFASGFLSTMWNLPTIKTSCNLMWKENEYDIYKKRVRIQIMDFQLTTYQFSGQDSKNSYSEAAVWSNKWSLFIQAHSLYFFISNWKWHSQ